jgi:hypothetical protein
MGLTESTEATAASRPSALSAPPLRVRQLVRSGGSVSGVSNVGELLGFGNSEKGSMQGKVE